MKDFESISKEVSALVQQLRTVNARAELHTDSRLIQSGDIFLAFPIHKAGDGRDYIGAAIKNGARAIVLESNWIGRHDLAEDNAIDWIEVDDLIQKIAHLTKLWYGSKEFSTIAVTGTNGKTSCSQWIACALSQKNPKEKCAVIGTLGVGVYDNGEVKHFEETGFTTPDALQLQKRIARLDDLGVSDLAIEASSIGIHQGRLNGLNIETALFTNLTRDHLDYHGTMQAYAQAKLDLFDFPKLKHAVVNLDDEFSKEIVKKLQSRHDVRLISYGIESAVPSQGEYLIAEQIKMTSKGLQFYVNSHCGREKVQTQVIGKFNISNLLGVLGVLLAKDMEFKKAISLIQNLRPVKGRMQLITNMQNIIAVVDYAHTPDALEKAIQALKEVTGENHSQLWCVFGCGGDRDPGKRSLMGGIAQQADYVVITSDNPRTEDPQIIIQHILQGMNPNQVGKTSHLIEDRASAILFAIKNAQANDVVLIAGKGHEDYQDIKGKKWPFSDEEHVQMALNSIATNNYVMRGNQ